jgi:hypothetical protein
MTNTQMSFSDSVRYSLTPEGRLRVEITPKIWFELDTAAVDAMAQAFAEARTKMSPAVDAGVLSDAQ